MNLKEDIKVERQDQLQEQLNEAYKQLEKAKKVLSEKNRVICSLEDDLDHLIYQMSKKAESSDLWINRRAPGFSEVA